MQNCFMNQQNNTSNKRSQSYEKANMEEHEQRIHINP